MTEIPEWVGDQEINGIDLAESGGSISVGNSGVTRIERTFKSGMHSHIPYVRVWSGDAIHSEHCQHYIAAVWFAPKPT